MGELFQQLGDVFRNLFNSDALLLTLQQPEITVAAFVALSLVVFTETGLLIGFFLPGDSLLVTAGLVAYLVPWNVPLLVVSLCIGTILGDSLGYWIGKKSGPRLFTREKSWFFRRDYLDMAKAFYDRHGGKTILLARFVPIIRTFAPVVAGMARMEYRRFLSFNVLGAIGWVVSLVSLGWILTPILQPIFKAWFGPEFEFRKHVDKVIIVVVLLSIAPIAFTAVRQWFNRKKADLVTTAESK